MKYSFLRYAFSLCMAMFFAGMDVSGAHAAEEDWKTEEFLRSTGLELINAAAAYEKGFTGKGVTLGIVDTGVRTSHREFAGKSITQLFTASYVEDWLAYSHGSHVAGIMAANRDGREGPNMQGVAFDAALVSAGWGQWDAAEVRAALQVFHGSGVRVINNSWGRLDSVYEDCQAGTASLRQYASVMSPSSLSAELYRMARTDDVTMVLSAGNNGSLGPSTSASMRTWLPELTNWISVMALDSWQVRQDASGRKTLAPAALPYFTNLAFGAEDYSILAPGMSVYSVAATVTRGYMRNSGTSQAAPHVSGALGLVQQAYPWMSGRNLTDTVLSTADRSFAHANYHIALDVYQQSMPASTQRLGMHVIFTDGQTHTTADVYNALAEYYAVADNAAFLQVYGIDSLQKLRALYDGTALPEDLLLVDGKPYFDVLLRGDMQNASFASVYGQGILDVGKAVDGIAQLNANRMTTADIDAAHGLLYPLSFDKSFGAAVFSNDIDQQAWIPAHHMDDGSLPALSAQYAVMAAHGDTVGLLKDGTGLLSLTGTGSYLGDTVIRGGALALTPRPDGSGGRLTDSSVYVEAAGRLQGSGSIAKTLYNSGVVAPDSSTLTAGRSTQDAIGTLTVGNFIQDAAGTLAVDFTSAGAHDVLRVLGDAALGGTLAFTPEAGFYGAPQTFALQTLMPADGTVNNTLSRAVLEPFSPTLTLALHTAADRDSFTIAPFRAADAYSRYADTANARRLGGALPLAAAEARGDVRNLFAALDFSAMDGGQVRSALHQLTPSLYASAALSSFSLQRAVTEMVLEELHTEASGGARAGAGSGAPAGWRAFARAFGGSAHQGDGNGMDAYSAAYSGILGGITRSTPAGLTVGAHAAAGMRSLEDDMQGKLSGEGFWLGGQARFLPADWGGWNVFGVARAGMETQRRSREVAFNAYAREAQSRGTAFSGTLRGGVGYAVRTGNALTLEPVAALDYAGLFQPAVEEDNGAGMRLDMEDTAYHSLRSVLGLRLAGGGIRLGKDYALQAHVNAAWNHELLARAGTAQMSFVEAPSASFTQQAEYYSRDSLNAGAGLSLVNAARALSLNADISGEFAACRGNAVYGGLSASWQW